MRFVRGASDMSWVTADMPWGLRSIRDSKPAPPRHVPIAQNRSTAAAVNSICCNAPWQKPKGSQKVSDELSLRNVGL